MKSHWIIIFKGKAPKTFIKKFEKFLGTSLIDIKIREDYIVDKINYFYLDCFIEHLVNNSQDAQESILKSITKISAQWDIVFLDGYKQIQGSINIPHRETHGGYDIDGPSGIHSISWTFKENQEYLRSW